MPAVKLLSRPDLRQVDERAIPKGKTTALLYYLAYQDDWVNRADVLYLFWPDTEEQKARRNLRQLLSSVRALNLEPTLETTGQQLRWCVHTDTQDFKTAIAQDQWETAIDCFKGHFLEGVRADNIPEFESWLELERHDLFKRYRKAVFQFVNQLKAEQRFGHASKLIAGLYQFDPLDEGVLRLFLELLALNQQHDEAIKVYESFQQQLALEYAGEPTRATLELVERIRAGEGTVAAEESAPSQPSLASRLTMLVPTTAFVGRATEIEQVTKLLRDPACRLLNIIAPGGMGKTRLAMEVATQLAPDFVDGVCFIPFEPVSAPEGMVAATASALNVSFYGQQKPKDQLFAYLKHKAMLLIADNLEHLLAGNQFISELLASAPHVKVLATSREHLNLHAEWLYDLNGMSIAQTATQADDAIQLFVQSARKARASFTLNTINSDAITLICEQLGGMPLGIEIAASWLRVLTPQEITVELRSGLDTLTTSLQDMPERHHHIRKVFEVSWQRLSSSEQAALKHLAVFHGGFNKKAAQAVAKLSLPLLLGLSNKSFLRRDDEGRFTQHPLMWQFIREKAEQENAFTTIQEHHARYFALFLKESEDEHEGLEVVALQQAITLELANILVAWEWMVANRREDLLALAWWGLCEYYRGLNRFHEGEVLLSKTQKRLLKESPMRIKLLHRLGIFHNMLGSYDAGLPLIEECLVLSRQHKLIWDEAYAHFVWAINRGFAGQVTDEELRVVYQNSVDLFRRAGDRNQEARALNNMAESLKDPVERENVRRRCIAAFRETGAHFGLTSTMRLMAYDIVSCRGAFDEAALLMQEAIAIERKRHNPFRLIMWLIQYGHISIDQGDLDQAQELFDEAYSLTQMYASAGRVVRPERALYGLGCVAFAQENYQGARKYWQETLALTEETTRLNNIYVLNSLCTLAIVEQQYDEAYKLSESIKRLKPQSRGQFEVHCVSLKNLADLHLAKGDKEGAIQFLQAALRITQEWTLHLNQFELLLSYSEFLQRQGHQEQAGNLLSFITNNTTCSYVTRRLAQKRLDGLQENTAININTQMLTVEDVIADILHLNLAQQDN